MTIVEGRPVGKIDTSTQVDIWLETHRPTHIILGPGPSRPEVSPLSMEIAHRALQNRLKILDTPIPLLGWCLGHQAIGLAAGWNLIESPLGAVHGVPSRITHDGSSLFENASEEVVMMRYNSLVLEATNEDITANSWDESGSLIMGLSHPSLPIEGVQFHPESVGSPDGLALLRSFLSFSNKVTKFAPNKQVRRP